MWWRIGWGFSFMADVPADFIRYPGATERLAEYPDSNIHGRWCEVWASCYLKKKMVNNGVTDIPRSSNTSTEKGGRQSEQGEGEA